jgi:transcriptional regulator with XRE-family HTH domain
MSNQIDQEVGARLGARRREIGLSLETLAATLKITPDTLESYEKGESRLSARVLQGCCRELNVSPSHFLAPSAAGDQQHEAARDELLSDAHRLHRAFFRIESEKLRKILVDLATAFADGGQDVERALEQDADGAATNDNVAILRRFSDPGFLPPL